MPIEQVSDRVEDLIHQIDLDRALVYIQTANLTQLRELNRLVVSKIRYREKEDAFSFERGNLVSFTITGKKKKSSNGEWRGIVTKVIGRMVEVDASKGKSRGLWKVSPGFLRLEMK